VTYQLRSDCEFFVASAYSWHWIFQLWTSWDCNFCWPLVVAPSCCFWRQEMQRLKIPVSHVFLLHLFRQHIYSRTRISSWHMQHRSSPWTRLYLAPPSSWIHSTRTSSMTHS
jgi:hypothetical protein